LIAYFIGNISAKKYQNPFMCVKVIASQRWDVFWDTMYRRNRYTERVYASTLYSLSLHLFNIYDRQNNNGNS